jgi:hypothetical protein
VANVIPSSGDYVFGLCFLLSREDERRLDRNEGVSTGAYEKDLIPIKVFPATASIVGRRVKEVDEYIYARAVRDEAPHQSSSTSTAAATNTRNTAPTSIVAPRYYSRTSETLNALVYVNWAKKDEGSPRPEYIPRIRSGIEDGLKLGIPKEYFERYINRAMEGERNGLDYRVTSRLEPVRQKTEQTYEKQADEVRNPSRERSENSSTVTDAEKRSASRESVEGGTSSEEVRSDIGKGVQWEAKELENLEQGWGDSRDIGES